MFCSHLPGSKSKLRHLGAASQIQGRIHGDERDLEISDAQKLKGRQGNCSGVWKCIGVMVCKKSAYPNCSGALTNYSGRLITVPEYL